MFQLYENPQINKIHITLGNKCIHNCAYCMQRGNVTDAAEGLSENFLRYLDEQVRKFSIFTKRTIRLTGGEPLLYWQDITRLIKTLDKYHKTNYLIVTGGSELTQDMVDFINKYKIKVGLSHDGPNVLKTRGYDLFQDKLQLVQQIHNLYVMCVFCSETTDLSTNANYFENKLERPIEMVSHLVYDTGDCRPSVLEFNLNRTREHLKQFMAGITHTEILEGKTTRSLSLQRYYSMVKGNMKRCSCEENTSDISFDGHGNVLTCHNFDNKVGTYQDELTDLLLCKKQRVQFDLHQNCRDCIALSHCAGSCPYINNSMRQRYYCDVQKIITEEIFNVLERLEV